MQARTIKLLLVSLSLLVLVVPQTAQSQEARDITATPAIIETAAKPGQSISGDFTIFNNGDTPLPITLDSKSLLIKDEIIDKNILQPYDASSWLEFTKSTYAIESNNSQQVDYTIRIPKDVAPGGHYAEITVNVLNLSGKNTKDTELLPELTLPVFINTGGEINEALNTNISGIVPFFVQKNRNTTSNISYSNTGNRHVLPTTKIEISNNEEIVHTETVPPVLVLPNTTKRVKYLWSADLDYGIYNAKVTVSYGANQKIVNESKILIVPNVWLLTLFTTLVVAAGYLFNKRKNLQAAFVVLKTGKKA